MLQRILPDCQRALSFVAIPLQQPLMRQCGPCAQSVAGSREIACSMTSLSFCLGFCHCPSSHYSLANPSYRGDCSSHCSNQTLALACTAETSFRKTRNPMALMTSSSPNVLTNRSPAAVELSSGLSWSTRKLVSARSSRPAPIRGHHVNAADGQHLVSVDGTQPCQENRGSLSRLPHFQAPSAR